MHQQEDNFDIFGEYAHRLPYNQQSPLYYLEDNLKRKPRSSMESRERSLDIPICQPIYI